MTVKMMIWIDEAAYYRQRFGRVADVIDRLSKPSRMPLAIVTISSAPL